VLAYSTSARSRESRGRTATERSQFSMLDRPGAFSDEKGYMKAKTLSFWRHPMSWYRQVTAHGWRYPQLKRRRQHFPAARSEVCHNRRIDGEQFNSGVSVRIEDRLDVVVHLMIEFRSISGGGARATNPLHWQGAKTRSTRHSPLRCPSSSPKVHAANALQRPGNS
jgi:hypothetical protein